MGDRCKIQNFATLYQGLKIGNDVFIGPHVCFTNDLYPRAAIWNEERFAKTLVKDGASVGANSTIIAGVTIGKYAMVGAGAVVTKDVPDYGVVIGNPAQLKGFICACGTRLRKSSKTPNKVLFQCMECGKKVEVEKQVFEELSG